MNKLRVILSKFFFWLGILFLPIGLAINFVFENDFGETTATITATRKKWSSKKPFHTACVVVAFETKKECKYIC